jgi:PleD family two-component response regulator
MSLPGNADIEARVNAAALVVGARTGATAALQELAHAVGFMPVERYAGLASAERQARETPLVFFLCAEVPDVNALKPTADAIRFSISAELRFSPLIYFSRSLSVDDIRACIRMGFDDVIALPYKPGELNDRLFRQVGRTQIYYETATYFGPDRRNRLGNARSSDSDHGGGQFRRIEIVRNPRTGVDVLRDDFQVVV